MRLAVLTTYFNPADYERLSANYERFCRREQGPDFFALEAVWEGQNPPGFGESIAAGAGNVLWQKERMLNELVARLPLAYDAVAWVDADVEFSNPRWREDAAAALEAHPVVQLFTSATWLDSRGDPFLAMPGAVAGGDLSGAKGHPGFAWAARREVFPLYDAHPMGVGDQLNAIAWLGAFGEPACRRLPAEWRREFLLWALPRWDRVRGNLGHLPGECRHWWHGSRKDRRYWDRLPPLYESGFLPGRDLAIGANGLYELARTDVRMILAEYFGSRNEDDPGP